MFLFFFIILIIILIIILLWGRITNWKFTPKKQYFKIQKSLIEGNGLFANKNFSKNKRVFSKIIDENLFHKNYQFNYPFNMINHSWIGNTTFKKIGDKKWGLFSTRKISKGEEITANYNKQPYFIKRADKNWD